MGQIAVDVDVLKGVARELDGAGERLVAVARDLVGAASDLRGTRGSWPRSSTAPTTGSTG